MGILSLKTLCSYRLFSILTGLILRSFSIAFFNFISSALLIEISVSLLGSIFLLGDGKSIEPKAYVKPNNTMIINVIFSGRVSQRFWFYFFFNL